MISMKKIIVLLATTFLHTLSAQTPEKLVKSTVQKATVFQQGALLTANEAVLVNSGMTNIVFENVSSQLLPNSVQASGKNDLIIMDVQYRLKYAEVLKTDVKPDDPKVVLWRAQTQAAQDSLEDMAFWHSDIQHRNQTLQTERNVLTGNRMMRGDFQKDSLPIFAQTIDFLRTRLMNMDDELLKLEREAYQYNRLRHQLVSRINRLNSLIQGLGVPVNSNPTKPVSQVIVTVMAERTMVADVTLIYFVNAAGWTASYDLKASKESQNIDLKHRATVYQNTGLDWKDVLITLSTGNPSQTNVKPTLSPDYLAFQPIVYEQAKRRGADFDGKGKKNQSIVYGSVANGMPNKPTTKMPAPIMAPAEPRADMNDEDPRASVKVEEKEGVIDFTQVTQNMMRVEYEIKLKYTIESDNKPHNVVIQSKTMPAQYSYSVVPKLDLDAFLIARVTEWEDMNLIPGTARVYFDNSYIGESYINPRNTNDTLQLNLGRDKSIVVTRSKVKDKCKDKSFSDNHLLTRVYEIKIRNTKNIPIRMVVEDQMPVSKEPTIKIEYLENSDAKFNGETGKLLWDFNLKPRDAKKLVFSFEIKSPKDKPLSNI
jgi:uncharacterized protein (TIGR02231 family)